MATRTKKAKTSNGPLAARARAEGLEFADEAFRLQGGVGSIELAEKPKEDKPARFRLHALSGKPISHWLWENLAIDLETLRVPERMPILRQHDPGRVVGFSDAVSIDAKKGLDVDGQFSRTTDDGAEVAGLLDEGFPWQASIAARPGRIEFIEKGSSVEVNGRQLKGPGTVFRDTEVSEVSFVALGADTGTGVRKLSANPTADEILSAYTRSEKETGTMAGTATEERVEQSEEERQKLLKEGAALERARVKRIQELALPGQEALAAQAIAEGWEPDRAMEAFLRDEREHGDERRKKAAEKTALERHRKNTVPDLGPSNGDGGEGEGGKPDAFDPEKAEFDEERFAAFWDKQADTALKREFGGDKNVFLAHYRNASRSRVFRHA